MLATSHSLLKSIILLEVSRYKQEMGNKPTSWKQQLLAYEQQKNLFVHFSNYPKMGLYLVNEYKTPIGFYSYPLNRKTISEFATDRPFMIIIKPKPEVRILDLETYSRVDLERDTNLLLAAGFDKGKMEFARVRAYESDNKYASIIWNITRELAISAAAPPPSRMYTGPKGGGTTGLWTYLLWKVLGYDGVVDNGLGLIYSDEPFQAAWFNTTKVEVVDILRKEGGSRDNLFREDPKFVDRRITTKELASIKYLPPNLRNYIRADFSNQTFEMGALESVQFFTTHFRAAKFFECNMKNLRIEYMTFNGSKFTKTNMNNGEFLYCNFGGCVFVDVVIAEADFRRSRFLEADLRGMKGWETADFNGSVYNKKTKFPPGFDPKKLGMINDDDPQLQPPDDNPT